MPIGSDKNRPEVIGTGEISRRVLKIFAVRICFAAYGQTFYGERPMTIDALNGVKLTCPAFGFTSSVLLSSAITS